MDAAPPGAEIRVATGTYTQTQHRAGMTQLLYLSKTLTLRGGYTTTHWQHAHPISFPTRLDAGGRGRVLYISGEISPTLAGFHVTGGDAQGLGGAPDGANAGGGIYIHQARAHLQQFRVYSNTAHVGGGLYLRESASTISVTLIAGNQAFEGGGGLYLHASDGADLRFNQITGNKILDGNGAGLALERSRARLDGNQITDNVAYRESGGGISLYHHSDADLRNNVVANNRAGRSGSGIHIEGASPTLQHTTLVSNTGGGSSGIAVRTAIFWEERVTSTVRLINTIISEQAVGVDVAGENRAALAGTLWATPTLRWAGDGALTHTADITGAPAFVAPERRDFHLTVDSPARDAGLPTKIAHDMDGGLRPIMRHDLGADEYAGPAMALTLHAAPTPVPQGRPFTYTLRITNTGGVDLHATVTDTLPAPLFTADHIAGTVRLPGGKLVWHPIIEANGGGWSQQITLTATCSPPSSTLQMSYLGPITNVVAATTLEGPSTLLTHTTHSVVRNYLPLIMRNYIPPKNVLRNPGFEGLGLPEDNDAPNPDNWTRDTFNGIPYGEIFTPEGWVTWWEEGPIDDSEAPRRPEVKVIPREPPFTSDPMRIYEDYYAAMYFSFYRTHNAGYYQQVADLPPGVLVKLHAHAHGWSCTESGGFSCGDPENMGFYVGIDPTGGTDPWSEAIIWSARTLAPDDYRKIGPVAARVGDAGTVTVFLRSDIQWPYKHNDAYWDKAALMAPIP